MNQNNDQPLFARQALGPLGALVMDRKTKLDEETDRLFVRLCELHGTDPSTVIRDHIYADVYQRTWSELVEEKRKHDEERKAALRRLQGPIRVPEFGRGFAAFKASTGPEFPVVGDGE